MKKNLPIQNLH